MAGKKKRTEAAPTEDENVQAEAPAAERDGSRW